MSFVPSNKPCRENLLFPQMRMIVHFPFIWINGRRGGPPSAAMDVAQNGKHHRQFQEQTERAFLQVVSAFVVCAGR